jgi:hypothetical protein
MMRALSIVGDVAVIAFWLPIWLVCAVIVECLPVDEARRVG